MTAPIIGATTPDQLRENAKASGVKLSAEDLTQIESILTPGEGK